MGRCHVLRPQEHSDRQTLQVLIPFVQDYCESATKFITVIAHKPQLVEPSTKPKRRSSKKTTAAKRV